MKPNHIHDPKFWLQELDPLLRELDFAFHLGVPKAHLFFTDYHKKPVNRPLLSNLVRYHALEYLWSKGFSEAKEEDGDGWGLHGLPNNGIELLYKQSCIRVRKGIDPPYPTTGTSIDFYQQKLFEEMEHGVVTNLLILYNLDASLQYDGKLKLMRPTKLNAKQKRVKCDWSATVELHTVDLSHSIGSDYQHGKDLPIGGEQDEQSQQDGTGTDGKDK